VVRLGLGQIFLTACCWHRPYATSITLTALANLLNTREKVAARFVDKTTFFNLTLTYARSHRRTIPAVKALRPEKKHAEGGPGKGEFFQLLPFDNAVSNAEPK